MIKDAFTGALVGLALYTVTSILVILTGLYPRIVNGLGIAVIDVALALSWAAASLRREFKKIDEKYRIDGSAIDQP